jgi:2-polyprenyl-3-methyl-5-hydroxy-6-metoxy-1,4-benzoquinol methylase
MSINEYLSEFVKGENVLDLGCVEHSASSEESEFWLHRHLVRSAKSVLGLDIVEGDVEALRKRGYNIICADATTVSLDKTFDVVVAGELIEHVINPGGLLTNMRRHLNENGRLIITTPHTFYLINSLIGFFSAGPKYWHPDHVAWYCPYVLKSMLHKTGYEMEACYYFNRSRKLAKVLRALHAPCARFMAQSIVVVAKPAQ